jgi:RND family efflux transporter MFP subunit
MLTLGAIGLMACHSHPHEHEAGEHAPHEGGHGHAAHEGGHEEAHGHGERPSRQFTDWSQETELFIEVEAFVKGEDAAAAAHVTRLADFMPLSEGRVALVLRGTDGDERFEAGPSVPGIFRPVARPAKAGPRRLIVEIRAGTLKVDHDLGEVVVAETLGDVAASHEAEGEHIAFTKEQQWPIAFRTALPDERPFRPHVRALGRLVPRAGGEVTLTAPVSGRLSGDLPQAGQEVSADALLLALSPKLETADVATLELAVTSASLELTFASRERDRLEGLRASGAIAERRVTEATQAVEQAKVAVQAAKKRLEQFRRARAGESAAGFEVRAPFASIIEAVFVAPLQVVEAGSPLVTLLDRSEVWLEASIPAIDAARALDVRGASVRFEGSEALLELGPEALVALAPRLDARTQTLPLTFRLDPKSIAGRPLGASAEVSIVVGEPRRALAVSASAIVDDGGLPVVFVQVGGESFARRIVQLGARDGGFVEVTSGISEKDRIVTVGAWSVKLAASSGAVPAHGHSH